MSSMLGNILSIVAPSAISVATRLGAFNPSIKTEELEASLTRLTGSTHLVSILLQCTPWIQKKSEDILGGSEKEINNLLLQAVYAAVLKIEHPPGNQLIPLLFDQIAKILFKIDRFEESVEGVSKELLALFFPNGSDDLPLPTDWVRRKAWEGIQSKIITYAKKLHKEFIQVSSAPYEKKLIEAGKEALLEEYRKISKNLVHSIPKMIGDQSDAISLEITTDPSGQREVSDWIKKIASSENLGPIWGFLEKQIDPVILHLLGNFTKYGERKIQSTVIGIVDQSISEDSGGSFDVWAQNSVKNLLSEMGWEEHQEFPMAKTLRQMFYPLLKDLLVKHITEIYKNLDKTVLANNTRGQKLENFIGEKGAEEIEKALSSFSKDVEVKFVRCENAFVVKAIIEGFAKSTILVSCTNLFGRIHKVNSPDLLSTIAVSMLKEMGNHFFLLNEIRKKEKKIYAYQVSYPVFVQEFEARGHLTNGVPKSQNVDQERIDGFFIPLVQDIMAIIGMSADQIPASCDAMRGYIWGELTTKILPKVFCDLYKSLLNPTAMHALLFSLIEEMKIESGHSSDIDQVYKDLKQTEITQVLEDLILKVIQLIPGTGVDRLLSIDKFKKLIVGAIGNRLRKQLESVNLMKILEDGIVKGLSREGDTEKIDRVPNTLNDEEMKAKLQKALVEMIIRQASATFKNTLNAPWNTLHKVIEKFVSAVLGKFGLCLKGIIDQLCHLVFIDLIGSIIRLGTAPIEYMILKIIRRHLNRKVEVGIELLSMSIHEDLLYKETRCVLNNFVPSNQKTC